jgi:hypothetical protein
MLRRFLSRLLTPAVFLSLWLAVTPAWAGSMLLLGAGGSGVVAPSFQGPGDIVSGAIGFWSCSRAYNAAYATGTNNACDLADTATGLTVFTMKILTSGYSDVAGAAASAACASSCSVKKMYDQTGHGLDLIPDVPNGVQAVSHWPVLTFNFIHAIPCASFSSAVQSKLISGTVPLTAQPITFSGVIERTANFTSLSTVMADSGFSDAWMFNSAINSGYFYAGTVFNPTVSDSALHAIQAIYNNTTSSTYIDGSDSGNQTFGTGSFGGASNLEIGMRFSSTQPTDSTFCELMVYPSGFNGTQKTNMNANQHGSASGYNF